MIVESATGQRREPRRGEIVLVRRKSQIMPPLRDSPPPHAWLVTTIPSLRDPPWVLQISPDAGDWYVTRSKATWYSENSSRSWKQTYHSRNPMIGKVFF